MEHDGNSCQGTPKEIKTSLSGFALLFNPTLNKGSSFTDEERKAFGLQAMLPIAVNSLDQQTNRSWQQMNDLNTKLQKNNFLQSKHDQNEVLFYNILVQHLGDLLDIIYTPTEGEWIEKYSHEFRRPRGAYLSFPQQKDMRAQLLDFAKQQNVAPSQVDLIVVTDSEEILGIGDQGVGGIGISVAKGVLYTAMGGVHPGRFLPVVLDVGTNRQELLDDPLYLGWRHKRVAVQDYDAYLETFVRTVQEVFPNAFLHWEDFGLHNARKLLVKYQHDLCTFNDDIQGTGAVTLATILAALKIKKEKLLDQRICIFGAGTAGVGIADQIRQTMELQGVSTEAAAKQFYCVDKPGLLTQDMKDISKEQTLYARSPDETKSWASDESKGISLLDTVKHAKPTILIGTSTVHGAFTKEVVEAMSQGCSVPIILPLSNPTRLCEADPQDLVQWTEGNVLIATGSPFPQATYNEKKFDIAECNNAFIFPGLGLACVLTRPPRLTDGMIAAAASALAECSPAVQSNDLTKSLLPDVKDGREVSVKVAVGVAKEALAHGGATVKVDGDVESFIRERMWNPVYPRLVPLSEH